MAATGTDDTAALASPADSADISGAAGNANLSDASDEAGLGPSCGGRSFTAGTKVLLATGAAVPIAKLHRGQKVLATNTRTGKTRPEPITAVLAHHDTNRYNLTLHTTHGTAVIHTTRTHLFWAPTAHRWIKAAALHHGTHLATPGAGSATVLGGHTPRTQSGWMWDLTIPHDHDFYVIASDIASTTDHKYPGVARSVPVLVHNCAKNQGVYIFDDLTRPDSVYIGKTLNFAARLGKHVLAGRLGEIDDAICLHVCGENAALLIREHIFKVAFQDWGFPLSSPVERYGENLYNARKAAKIQLELPFDWSDGR